MNEDLQFIIEETAESMEKTLEHLSDILTKIRAGKASPQMLSDIYIDYYGAKTPLNQAATINTPDPKSIIIQPWDRSVIVTIEKAIQASNLGFNPQNDGEVIRINVPPLTEERRLQLVKYIQQEGENNKISVRNARKKANEEIKDIKKSGVSEDEVRKAEDEIQELTNKHIKRIEEFLKRKEEEIMTV